MRAGVGFEIPHLFFLLEAGFQHSNRQPQQKVMKKPPARVVFIISLIL